MSRVDGVLVVSLTHKWFDMIASGEKLEEYRGGNWTTRLLSSGTLASVYDELCGGTVEDPNKVWWGDGNFKNATDFHPYHTFRAQRAYSGVWLERKIRKIRWGKPRPEWSGETVTGDCFVIELDPCT